MRLIALCVLVPSVALAACGGDETAAAPAAQTPTPYTYDPGDADSQPTLTADDIRAAVEPWLAPLFLLQVAPLLDGYHAMMARGDGACPAASVTGGDGYSVEQWYNTCVASSGTSFDGSAYGQTTSGTDANGYLTETTYFQIQAAIEAPDGTSLQASGYVVESTSSGTVDASWYKSIQGNFGWNGEGSEGTWMSQGLKVYCETAAYTYFGLGNYVEMTAGVSGLSGDVTAVSTSHLKIYQKGLGSRCEQEPSGSVSVRGADGEWYDVVFDAPDDDHPDVDPALCDGCGTVYYRGQAEGSACIDFSSLLAWGPAPW